MATAQAAVHAGYHPQRRTGLWDWLTTVDHKKIGILYGGTALFFLAVGGLEAMGIRTQLIRPDNHFLTAELYDEFFTMHGVTMVFLMGMPISVALFNYIVPLQIGARDVAFPRLNALSYWIFLFGGLFLYSSWFFHAAPNGGWFGYANLSERPWASGPNMDFYALGLQMLGVASIMGGVNFLTTIINLRAPGMRLMRMPLFTWMTFVTSFLLVTALPVLAVALFFLTFDRMWGTNFYIPANGGDPILWQHLFWMFGHPEVYILILPAFGIISDVVPTFSRKPLFGYAAMVYSGCLIGLISWGVWAHHMFTTGLGPIADAFFTITTMIIAIPTGVKIFNWLATMWGGQIRFTTSMLFAVGMIGAFTLGGISGVMHATSPHDWQQTDTYFVIAHFHYVLVGGTVMGIFAGSYYWFPKITGRFMSETLGKWHFWLWFVGMNLAFFPMHWIGLLGMPRRTYRYAAGLGLTELNFAATIGAYIMGVAFIIYAWNLVRSVRRGAAAGANPWNAATLEWATTSPPPEYNFGRVPTVRNREPLWLEGADEVVAAAQAAPPPNLHMPPPSHWPILTALGICLTLGLFLTHVWFAPIFGLAFTLLCVMNFAFEPVH